MTDQHAAQGPSHLGELVAPALGRDHFLDELADHRVEDEVLELVLVLDVPVERGRAGFELLAELAHGQRRQPVAVGQPDRGRHDLVAREGPAGVGHGGGRRRPSEVAVSFLAFVGHGRGSGSATSSVLPEQCTSVQYIVLDTRTLYEYGSRQPLEQCTSKESQMSRTQVRARRWWILGVLILALFGVSLDNTILNVALPTLAHDLSASASQLQWMVDAYILVFAGLLLVAGALATASGDARPSSSAWPSSASAPPSRHSARPPTSSSSLRAFMGVGAAFIMPVDALHHRPRLHRRRRAGQGHRRLGGRLRARRRRRPPSPAAGCSSTSRGARSSSSTCPSSSSAHRRPRVVPESRDPAAPRLDLIGTVLSVVGLVALSTASSRCPRQGWADPVILVALVLGGRADRDVLRLGAAGRASDARRPAFRQPALLRGAALAITLVFFSLFGVAVLPHPVPAVRARLRPARGRPGLAPVAARRHVSRRPSRPPRRGVGAKAVVAAGLLVVAGGAGDARRPSARLRVLHVRPSCCRHGRRAWAWPWPRPPTSIMGSLPPAKSGVGSAVNDTTREVGGALGVAILGSLFAAGYASTMDAATVVAGLPAEAAAAAHDSLGGPPRSPRPSAARRVPGSWPPPRARSWTRCR